MKSWLECTPAQQIERVDQAVRVLVVAYGLHAQAFFGSALYYRVFVSPSIHTVREAISGLRKYAKYLREIEEAVQAP